MTSPPTARLPDLEHPWLGLESFREETRAFFFGRDTEISEIHLRLRSHPLLVLYGRSGLGKTSILTAGLLPRLRAEGQKPALVRLRYEDPASDPVTQLVNAVFQDVSPNEWLAQLGAKLKLQLPNDPASLLWLRLHYRAEPPAITHLILDQFEEVFTVGARRPDAQNSVRDALANFLQGFPSEPIAKLVEEEDSFSDYFDADAVPVRVILSLRDDYVYALNRWRRHISALGQNSYELRALRGTAAFDAVYQPGRLRCENSALPPIVDEETAQRIVRFVARKEADAAIEEIEAVPPILSLLCRELNERRFTTAPPSSQITFREGDTDIGSIISSFYERCLWGKPEAVRIFIEEELVGVSGARLAQDEGSILRVFTDGCAIPGAVDGHHAAGFGDAKAARACLDELVDDRLLNSLGGESPGFELIHDLIAGVAEKSRTAREQRFEKEEAERRAQAEKAAKEKAEAEARRFRHTAILVSLALIVAVIAGVIGYVQKKKALEAEARAMRARNEAEKLIAFMTFDLRDKLQPIGRLGLLRDVNEHARQYYESFGSEGETPDTLRQRGVMLSNQGNVAFDQGDLAEAEKDYRASLSIAEKLCQQDPKNALWQRDRGLAYTKMSVLQNTLGDLDGALASYQTALGIHEQLVRQDPDDSIHESDLADIYSRIGDVLRDKGDLNGALKNYHEGLGIQQKLTEKEPANSQRQNAVCFTYDALGSVEMVRGNLEAALKNFQESHSIREKLRRDNPADTNRQWNLSLSNMNLATAQKAQGDTAAANKSYQDAYEIRKYLCEQDLENTGWLYGLAETLENMSELMSTRGDLANARKNYDYALTIRGHLFKTNPNNAFWEWARSATLIAIGDIRRFSGQIAEASEAFNESLQIRQRLLEKNPGNAAGQREIFVSYDRIGCAEEDRGNLKAALENYGKFVAIGEKLVHDDPSNVESQFALSYAYDRVAEAIHQQGNYAGALQKLQDNLAVRERLAQQNPQNADWQWNALETRSEIADNFVHQGDAPHALEQLQAGLSLADSMMAKDPDDVFHKRLLAVFHGLLAQAFALQKDFPEAVREGGIGTKIHQEISDIDHDNIIFQIELATACNELASIQLEQNDVGGAKTNFQKSRELLEQLAPRAPEMAARIRQQAVAVHGLGDVQRMRGEYAAAMKNYREALATRERLTQRDQTNAIWQGDLAVTCWRTGATMLKTEPKSNSEAIKLIERGRENLRDLKEHASLTSEQQSWLDGMEADLVKLREAK